MLLLYYICINDSNLMEEGKKQKIREELKVISNDPKGHLLGPIFYFIHINEKLTNVSNILPNFNKYNFNNYLINQNINLNK